MPTWITISSAREASALQHSLFLHTVWNTAEAEFCLCYFLDTKSYHRLLWACAVTFDEKYFTDAARACFFNQLCVSTDSQVPDPPIASVLGEDAEATTG